VPTDESSKVGAPFIPHSDRRDLLAELERAHLDHVTNNINRLIEAQLAGASRGIKPGADGKAGAKDGEGGPFGADKKDGGKDGGKDKEKDGKEKEGKESQKEDKDQSDGAPKLGNDNDPLILHGKEELINPAALNEVTRIQVNRLISLLRRGPIV